MRRPGDSCLGFPIGLPPCRRRENPLTPLDDITLHHLGSAAKTLLSKTAQGCRDGSVSDPADHFAVTMASFLDGIVLTYPPVVDRHQGTLPFTARHEVAADVFKVARGGSGGGPTIDLLLQIWCETESMNVAFGVPLLMRRVPSFGPIPRDLWDQLGESARALNAVTGSGRLILIGEPDPFYRGPDELFRDTHGVSALPTLMIAGMLNPPRGVSGRFLDWFCDDLVSGWIGDPALSGRGASRVLEDALQFFDIARLLRIHIRKVAP